MGILEIISAIVLIVACVFIVLVVLMQDTKQGMSQTITGGSADNYYQRNSGRSNEAKLNRLTKIAAVIFFVVALVVNFVVMYSGNFSKSDNSSITSSATWQLSSTGWARTAVATVTDMDTGMAMVTDTGNTGEGNDRYTSSIYV